MVVRHRWQRGRGEHPPIIPFTVVDWGNGGDLKKKYINSRLEIIQSKFGIDIFCNLETMCILGILQILSILGNFSSYVSTEWKISFQMISSERSRLDILESDISDIYRI